MIAPTAPSGTTRSRINALTATLRDDTAPSVSLSGPLAAGAWLNQSQPVSLTVDAEDAGAGVAAASLRSAGTVLDSDSVAVQSATQPGRTAYSGTLSTSPAALGDGSHALDVVVADAAGETTTTPVQVKVDAHAPVAVTLKPSGSTTDLRPAVSFSVDPGPSGLGTLEASLDGASMQVTGADATFTPAADLTYGVHTVTFHATDGAGNSRDGAWTFDVVDTTPPSLSHAVPADGSSGEDRRPEVAFDVADAGIGIDPGSLHVVLDGVDVAAAGTLVAGHFSLVPGANLAYGSHRVKVTVADRSGNTMTPAEWTFAVADVTAPVLSDPTPKDGSSGADRTPAISFQVADAGIGVDPDAIAVSLDGSDITVHGAFADGRFSYLPTVPLGFGVHTVSARAADRAGNTSPAMAWSFTVADEQPPSVTGQRPVPGSIVPGATVIAFDMSDTGTGVATGTLMVEVDGSDVASWGTLTGSHFAYAPGNLGAGVHTIAVTVADNAGNVAGPVMWQFAVADPASLGLTAAGGPRVDCGRSCRHAPVQRHEQRCRDGRRTGARLGPARRERGLRPGEDRDRLHLRGGRVLGLAGADDGLPRRAPGRPERPDGADAGGAPARDARSVGAQDAPRRGAPADRPGRPGPGRARVDPAPDGVRLAHGGPPEAERRIRPITRPSSPRSPAGTCSARSRPRRRPTREARARP